MYRECVLWNEELIREVNQKKPTIIFISNLTNKLHPLEINTKNYRVYYKVGLEKMVYELSRVSKVVLIEDTPYPNFNVVSCLLESQSNLCDFPNVPNSLTLLSKLIARKNQATWVQTNKYFCKNNNCFASFEGVNLYRDESHISVSASEKFSGDFLDGIMGQTDK